ncbi:hypothetical protein K1719_041935 [Acacia pycnantha]|nr:hypothetical protein K1719_041935 [Acacia pycnantha]
MVARGGASVIYADTVGDLGYASELGNYPEYSGTPKEERHNSSTKGEGTARSSKDTHIREERRPQLSERSSEIAGTRESIGIPIQVYGPEETMTGICKQAIQCIIAAA